MRGAENMPVGVRAETFYLRAASSVQHKQRRV